MGGKKKGAAAQPRTKDNMKPSSSQKAAQFLIQQTGGLGLPSTLFPIDLVTTIPLSSVSTEPTESIAPTKVPGLVPVPQDPDAAGLEPRLLSTLKRLEKRDAVTKQKALKELVELLKLSTSGDAAPLETSAIVAVLPFWPRIYCRLAFDENRKVRELVQSAMCGVADRVHRELGPYIKQIFPVWAFSTVDVHEPAGTLANQGIKTTFPGPKRLEAYRVCARQILDLVENKISEEFTSSAPTVEDTTSKSKGQKEKRTTEIKSPEPPVNSDLENHLILQRAACLRFITSLVDDFSYLPDDSSHLLRLRKLLAPTDLWTVVSRHIYKHIARHTSADGRCLVGYSPAVHSALYRLATVLCTQSSWARWMGQTEDGRELATYLCHSIVARLGPVDRTVKPVVNADPCPIPAPLSVVLPGFGCYAQAWEAALACLTYLPAPFVWSIIDWRVDLCAPLELLLHDVGSGYAKQVYPNLLCLLNQLPLEYGRLSSDDAQLLETLFVDTALKGLERALVSRNPPVDSSVEPTTPTNNAPVSVDPSVSVAIVTGLLECCRFLIDRIATASETETKPDPMCLRIRDQVVMRLFADSLHVVRPDNVKHTYLVCAQPPLARQAYLEAVFTQVSALITNLARASEPGIKSTFFAHIRNELLRWVSETPKSTWNETSSSFEDPINQTTQLGLLDSLRLTQFANCLAHVASAQGSSRTQLARSTRLQQQPAVRRNLPVTPTVVQDSWCIDLFKEICRKIEAHFSSASLDSLVQTGFYVAYLSLSSYLPETVPVCLPHVEEKLFTVILPTLSDDLLSLFLMESAVRGLVRSWSVCSEHPSPAISSSTLTRHRFLAAVLPTLIDVVSPQSTLSQRIPDLCLEWANEWIRKLLSNSSYPDALSLNDLAALVSLAYTTTSTTNHPILVKLRGSLLSALLAHLRQYIPKEKLSDLTTLPAPLLHNMSVLCLMTLEEICPSSGRLPEFDDEVNSQITELLVIFLRLVLTLYVVHHFACVASVLDPTRNNLATLLSAPVVHTHPSGMPDLSDPPTHSLFELPLTVLLCRIERFFLSSSALIKLLLPKVSIPLILHHIVHLAYVPVQMIQFVELFLKQFVLTVDPSANSLLYNFWLSATIEAMMAVIDQVTECESFPMHTRVPPPRPVLFPAGLLPVNVAPHLGRLFRIWQLGSRLNLTNSSRCSVESDQWVQYMYCLGVLRGGLACLSEPLDPCVTFGWPSPFPDSELTQSEQDQQPIGTTANGHLDPARAAFGQWESAVSTQLGLCWHNATADIQLSTFIELMSYPAIRTRFPHLNERQISSLCSILNAICLNRIRSVHPNYWHRALKLAASCTDDPSNPTISWLEDNVISHPDRIDDSLRFNHLCEIAMPAGIVRRCLPRQELLGRLKCLTLVDPAADGAPKDNLMEPPDAHRVLQLLASLISVHTVSPVYATTFLSVLTVDYQKWLTGLADSGESDEHDTLIRSDSALVASLSAMGFLESVLLLWQPWQWYADLNGRSAIANHLGLIQLSMRLRQLRPVLTRSEWDLILCLIISWVCFVLEHMDDHKHPGENKTVSVLATRAFRVAAALAAIFIERVPDPVPFEKLIIPSAQSSKAIVSNAETPSEWEDDFDGELIDNEEDGENYDDQEPVAEDENDDADKCSNEQTETSKITEEGLLDELEDDPDSVFIEEELPLSSMDDDAIGDSDMTNWNSVQNLLPRKGRPPAQIRDDWDKFFAHHLYSSLLPSVFHSCLAIGPGGAPAVSITPRSLQSLCAVFATCSLSELLHLLTTQPHLILEYLVDLDRINVTGIQHQIKQLISKRSDSGDELTTGLRACIDFGANLIRCSPIQSGQLLGHVILSRALCARIRRAGSLNTLYLSNYLLPRLPTSWLLALYGSLPARLERDLNSDRALTEWGRGGNVLTYLVQNSIQQGWFLDVEAHHQLLSYLLSWDCLLTMLTSAGPQARARLQRALLGPSAALFDRFLLCLGLLLPPPGNLESMVTNPCRLEPDERLLLPVSASRTDLIAAMSLRSSTRQRLRRPMRLAIPVASGDDRDWRDPFSPDDRLLYLPGNRLASDISHMAVRLLRRFLAEAPALMRGWLTRLSTPAGISEDESNREKPDELSTVTTQSPVTKNELSSVLCGQRSGRLRQLANTVDKLVSRHFSPGLARDEVLLVQYKAQLREMKRAEGAGPSAKSNWFSLLSGGGPSEIGTINIRGRPLSREVIATYQVTEEHSVEMLIQLPANYPLGLVTVSCGRGVGIGQQMWHMWTVQLSVFINNQNGSILDGIDLWQKNVRKKFEGVEECAICYSVVHNTNFSLPKMQCHTCRKLFHYACMYRWFTTSHNPACPLCRHRFFGPTGRPIT